MCFSMHIQMHVNGEPYVLSTRDKGNDFYQETTSKVLEKCCLLLTTRIPKVVQFELIPGYIEYVRPNSSLWEPHCRVFLLCYTLLSFRVIFLELSKVQDFMTPYLLHFVCMNTHHYVCNTKVFCCCCFSYLDVSGPPFASPLQWQLGTLDSQPKEDISSFPMQSCLDTIYLLQHFFWHSPLSEAFPNVFTS